MPLLYWTLWIYLAAKADRHRRARQIPALFSWMGLLLLAELAVGVIAPLVLLSRQAVPGYPGAGALSRPAW